MTAYAPVVDLTLRRAEVDGLIAKHLDWANGIAAMFSQRDEDAAVAMTAFRKAAKDWDGKGDFHGYAYFRMRAAVRRAGRTTSHSASQVKTCTHCGGSGVEQGVTA